ncbi:hypothetical protein WMY93_014281 [Mugilogobius chulae]|uniref:Ig-like domain-containing protein n=1 Tax=Mugilogobius chulae TaxID=88201 RepID=A0AAW0P5H5_9GOBI
MKCYFYNNCDYDPLSSQLTVPHSGALLAHLPLSVLDSFQDHSQNKTPEHCKAWGTPDGMGCEVGPAVESDSGSYWCQNHNQTSCSPPANIIVTENKVILHSPVFPVEEEERVTMRCYFKKEAFDDPSSDFSAYFFRNNTLVGEFPKGEMVLESVAEKDEGLYRCEHKTYGSSLKSFLYVKPKVALQVLVTTTSAPHVPKEKPLHRILISLGLFLLYTVIFCISVSIYCKCTRARAELKQQESEMVSLRTIN